MKSALIAVLSLLVISHLGHVAFAEDADVAAVVRQADQWRTEKRIIDMHQHVGFTPAFLDRRAKIADSVGVGVAVSLGTGVVTPGENGSPSEFERNKKLADERHPGKLLHYMILDYRGWDGDDFAEKAAKQIEEGRRQGAAGLKEFKRLGLFLRDGKGKLIKIDDPKLDLMWEKCGELKMPVSIHVGDPKAFFEPFNDKNERWKELKDHRNWWFGDTNKYPGFKEILESLNRVIAKHPKTIFVCVHFANNAEELEWVDASLSKYPNMMADLAARIPEIGRHNPEAVRKLFVKHQDRIFFGTDFQVYDRLILGSSGNEPPPTDKDGETFFAKEWRWLETRDRDWPHMTPIQGDWNISSIGLPANVLRKIYFDNARKLLARSFPAPELHSRHIDKDFDLDGDLKKEVWNKGTPARIEYTLNDVTAHPEVSTAVRCLWSDKYLYFSFTCPYTRLTVFDPPAEKERLGLWDRDVVEVFLGNDDANPKRYYEFEVAPSNERLDVKIALPDKDFPWTSGFTSAVKIDQAAKTWTAELRIPLSALGESRPKAGAAWKVNLFRSDRAANAFIAWNPTLVNTTHAPERFGTLRFEGK